MNNQNKGLHRNIIDKFYTKNKIVDLCMENIKKYLTIEQNDVIIEPSAGNGAFINNIKNITSNYIFYDIEPEHSDIIKQDYLLINTTIFNKYNKIHIIGNPPFGRQSSTVIKFIKKSSNFADTISFILPKSFKKQSLQKYFPLNFHLIHEIILPINSFIISNKEHNVPCVFQIWLKKK